MIKELKHKETGMVITVLETKETRECGSSIYSIKGYIYSTRCSRINVEMHIIEDSMRDFEITYKSFE